MTVDDEIEVLGQRLNGELMFQLAIHTGMVEWNLTDRLDNRDWENTNATIRDVFAPFIRQYGYTTVEPIMQNCRNVLIHVVWAAMNVPFPRNPWDHVERVVENTLNMFNRTMYANLRTEMFMVNHSAHIIQRIWRRAITDPSYLVCRSRLMYEFKKISSEMDMYGDIFSISAGL
jgi:hypothetical protein